MKKLFQYLKVMSRWQESVILGFLGGDLIVFFFLIN